MCTCRLADAGARVLKIERPEGDFARHYDDFAHGECSYFVWLNRGKESVVFDLVKDEHKALLEALLKRRRHIRANFKPGTVAKFGFPIARLRRDYPRGGCPRFQAWWRTALLHAQAYELVDSGRSRIGVDGTTEPSRVGVSVVDVATGMNAYEAILEALIARGRTGEGAQLSLSMFDAMADWMAVPLMQQEAGKPPQRVGLTHAAIAPYGAFPTRDWGGRRSHCGAERSQVNGACWRKVLDDPALAADPRFATNLARVQRRVETDGKVAAGRPRRSTAQALMQKLAAADIAMRRQRRCCAGA